MMTVEQFREKFMDRKVFVRFDNAESALPFLQLAKKAGANWYGMNKKREEDFNVWDSEDNCIAIGYRGKGRLAIANEEFYVENGYSRATFDNYPMLRPFDVVEHQSGSKRLVVEIDGRLAFSNLSGGGDEFGYFGLLPFEYEWSVGPIVRVWKSLGHGRFGSFLRDGFREEYFEISWEDERVVERRNLEESISMLEKQLASLERSGRAFREELGEKKKGYTELIM